IVASGLYSSLEMKRIDKRYSDLIDREMGAQHDLAKAQAHNNRFGMFLYKEVAETDPEQTLVIDAELDSAAADFHSATQDAIRRDPDLAAAVDPVIAQFNRIIADSNPVRAAAKAGDRAKANRLMQDMVDPEWSQTRAALIALQSKAEKGVQQESD